MTQYLLRFDDLCPTMDHDKWSKIEVVLERHAVKPILAVIPDNRQSNLILSSHDEGFWDRMRGLQSRGWAIGLHGYQHLCHTDPDCPYPEFSDTEFRGLSETEQRGKIERGIAIFKQQRLHPAIWVAPNHTFDVNTVRVLNSLGVSAISEGFALYPYRDENGMFWIPQQTCSFLARAAGVWTIVLHSNTMNDDEIACLNSFLQAHKDEFTSVQEIQSKYSDRRRSSLDRIFETYAFAYRVKKFGKLQSFFALPKLMQSGADFFPH